jgi:hypothetical protein
MPSKTSTPRYITWLFIGLFLVGCWFIAPFFLPMWKWQNVDFDKIAKERSIDANLLKTEFDVTVRFHPRGFRDPIPWQIIQMKPEWGPLADENEDEDHVLVRCSLIGDRTGTPPGALWVGNTPRDRYFKMKAWRFPGGVFGLHAKRPILLYQGMTFDKCSIGEAQRLEFEVNSWPNDDEWRERDDEWSPEVSEE